MTNNERIAKRFQFDLEMGRFKSFRRNNYQNQILFSINTQEDYDKVNDLIWHKMRGILIGNQNSEFTKSENLICCVNIDIKSNFFYFCNFSITTNDKHRYLNEMPDYIKEWEIRND